MEPLAHSGRSRSALRGPTVVLALLLVAAVPGPGYWRDRADPAPAQVSAADFLGLRWLEGTWRGRMPDGTPFYERYRMVDDSTFTVESFADSTLRSPRDIGRLELRRGALYRLEPSGARVPATHLDAAGVLFGTLERGFTWAPGAGGTWTAVIHRSDGGREPVYRMEPFPPAADRAAVERAVLDYVEALYRVEPDRIARSVHPELAKRGFSRGDAAGSYRESRMSYEQLHALAGRWNRSGRVDPASAVKQITIYDVLDQTATAKLVADWGVDYLHLARYDGVWKIVNVLWQSPPAAR